MSASATFTWTESNGLRPGLYFFRLFGLPHRVLFQTLLLGAWTPPGSLFGFPNRIKWQ